MKLTFRIALNELRNLFYAPIAWVLLVIFLALCAYLYTGIICPAAISADAVYRSFPGWKYLATESMTDYVFFNANGLFPIVLPNVYLFVPLLTMSIINREINNGTIRLLYSSPVLIRQIVFGKYLSILLYNLLLMLITGIFIVSGFSDIQSLDYGRLLSALLGLYLLLCALTAIGMFMSSLTKYPIVAAVASFVLLIVLHNIHKLWQDYDIIRDITWFMSVAGRTEKMMYGLIATKDIVYYLVIIFLFLSFTLLKLGNGRKPAPWFINTGRYLAVIAAGLLTGYVCSLPRFTLYWDATDRQTNTIHPRTQQIIKELKDTALEVTLYGNLFEAHGYAYPRGRNAYISQMWEKYQRFKPDIRLKYEYYYDNNPAFDDSMLYKSFPGKSLPQIAALTARLAHVDTSLYKSPEKMKQQIDLAPEEYRLVMKLRYNGRSTYLRTYTFPGYWPNEQNMIAALRRLQGAAMPKVCFATGNLERNVYKNGEREYAFHSMQKKNSQSLINTGFDTDTIDISRNDIPATTDILVLADPKTALSETALTRVQHYIRKGGNMLILGEPGKQHVLNPVLQSLGIQLVAGQIVQPSVNEAPDMVHSIFTPPGLHLSEDFWLLRYKGYWEHGLTYDSLWVITPGVTAISQLADSGFRYQPLTISPAGRSWLKAGALTVDSATPVFDAVDGDRTGAFPTMLALTRHISEQKEQRIIVCGDADQIDNYRGYNNVVYPLYSWLCNNEYPAYTPIPYARDNMFILSPRRARIEKIIYCWILPSLTILAGAILLIRRRKK